MIAVRLPPDSLDRVGIAAQINLPTRACSLIWTLGARTDDGSGMGCEAGYA